MNYVIPFDIEGTIVVDVANECEALAAAKRLFLRHNHTQMLELAIAQQRGIYTTVHTNKVRAI